MRICPDAYLAIALATLAPDPAWAKAELHVAAPGAGPRVFATAVDMLGEDFRVQDVGESLAREVARSKRRGAVIRGSFEQGYVVVVVTKTQRRKLELHASVFRVSDGSLVVRRTLARMGGRRAGWPVKLLQQGWKRLGTSILRREETAGRTLASAHDSFSDSGVTRVRSRKRKSSEKRKYKTFAVSAGLSVGARSFSYENPQRGVLRPYEQVGLLLVGFKGELFPFRHKPKLPLRGLMVFAEGQLSVGSQTEVTDLGTVSLDVSWTQAQGGFGYQFGNESSGNTFGGPRLGLDINSFRFGQPTDAPVEGVPDVAYVGFTGGAMLGHRFSFGTVHLDASVILPVSSGPLRESLLPRESLLGLRAEVGYAYQFAPRWNLSARVAYSRYDMSFRTRDTDSTAADAAVDQYVWANTSVGWSY